MQQEKLYNSYNIKHFSFTLSYVVYFEMKKKTGNVIVTYPITQEYLLQTRAVLVISWFHWNNLKTKKSVSTKNPFLALSSFAIIHQNMTFFPYQENKES